MPGLPSIYKGNDTSPQKISHLCLASTVQTLADSRDTLQKQSVATVTQSARN